MERRFRSFVSVGLAAAGVGLLATVLVERAKADTWDKMTYVTIHERIIAGNKVLEPGTYVWKLLDSPSDRHVVQIFNKDQTHLEETILTIPNYRLQPTGDNRFAFWETPAGVPKAVRAWFYPGDNFGQEFKYPKALVAQLASAVPVPIPVAYREPEPTPAPAQPVAQPEPQPQSQPTPVAAEPSPEPAPEPAPQAASTRATAPPEPATLPHTAGNLPLIGLLGLTSLGFAGVLSLTKQS